MCLCNPLLVFYFVYNSIDEGSGPIQLTNVRCLPSDDLIIQCPLGPFVPCTHAQDVVVACCKY